MQQRGGRDHAEPSIGMGFDQRWVCFCVRCPVPHCHPSPLTSPVGVLLLLARRLQRARGQWDGRVQRGEQGGRD